ncbi:MAG: hypothetical protein WDW36_001675 [Sanguina aurantia]
MGQAPSTPKRQHSGESSSRFAAPEGDAAPPPVTSLPGVLPAGVAPSGRAVAASAAAGHKSTTLIPGWSRSLSSQALHMECQKVAQPQRVAPMRDCYGVLDMEVMKFVAYCGGVTIKVRVDEVHAPVDGLSWGLASTRACPALVPSQLAAAATAAQQDPAAAAAAAAAAGHPGVAGEGRSVAVAGARPALSGNAASSLSPYAASACSTGIPVDSLSRKPLFLVTSTTTTSPIRAGDILTIELAPREDKQPVIMATLRLNDVLVLQSSLPCSTISSLQMYPFITVLAGLSVTLHEAVTPSPLFTWYSPLPPSTPPPPTSTVTQLAELDTCVKCQVPPAPLPSPPAPPPFPNLASGPALEFQGSMVFTGGRHRWTVQLDNIATVHAYLYVGVVQSTAEAQVPPASSVLANTPGPLRSIAGASTSQARALGAPGGGGAMGSAGQLLLERLTQQRQGQGQGQQQQQQQQQAGSVASGSSGEPLFAGPASTASGGGQPKPASSWGVWIKLPGSIREAAPAPGSFPTGCLVPVGRPECASHTAESSSSHCFVTVDLDLASRYVRFFRNGHLIGSAFTNVVGPVAPTIAFAQVRVWGRCVRGIGPSAPAYPSLRV